ncbi:anhydro-N-acetylmuramic acid kinase [Vibrio nitrifigilis]|uniref:Anhydro-N-acetylmuramic acid kinase n=1 Tax=Vibrio nitrifigilis TaxID=2789781 RepID=A0ABS0G9W7_9VIBR|nr:anhydro-N-acetylmuramic acid kinase [Vibrio nitrifigilis]MBF8999194.1 anhydro-N-acetylmuramic acid kinase [Vibrio nitrifigilis]
MMQRELYIGLMSGTSLDGIDVAITAIDSKAISLVASDCLPIPETLKAGLLSIALNEPSTIANIGMLDHQLGLLYSNAVMHILKLANLTPKDITAIGCHGQTVFHQPLGPHRFTVQLGDANLIAAQTGITTVADFRRKDMALGGQGAPLVPAFHQHLFGQNHSNVVILNIGGIANISILETTGHALGFDTGPGNMLMDAWCLKHHNHPFDQDAKWAQQGQIIPELLQHLMQDKYFALPSPKSTGREYFHLGWLEQHMGLESYSPVDVQRTLCELTALTVAEQIQPYQSGDHPSVYVCGGGAQNPLLMERLAQLLPNWHITTTSQQGVDSDAMEAMAFAWLAERRIHNQPSNLPSVTGACRPASLGVIYYPD